MWPFKKKSKTYARPNGWRAKPAWQIFMACRRHDMLVWLLLLLAFYMILIFVAVMIGYKGDFFGVCSGLGYLGDLSDESNRKLITTLSIMAIVFGFALLFVFWTQFIHAKEYEIPQAVPKILKLAMIAYLALGLLCSLAWSLLSWFGAFWGFATFLVTVGMIPLVASSGKRVTVVFVGIISCGAMFLFVDSLMKGWLDKPGLGLTLGSLAMLIAGVWIWWKVWYRFRYEWSPAEEDFRVLRHSTFLQQEFACRGGDDRFSRWIDRERERRIEVACQTRPKSLREQIRFFRTTSRPPRIGLAMVVGLVTSIPFFWMYPDEFLGVLVGVLYGGLLLFLVMTGAIFIERKCLFASESLLPISWKRYLLVTIVGRFQNLLLVLIPFTIFVLGVITIQAPHWYTQEYVVTTLLFLGMLSTLAPSLLLMAIYLRPYTFIAVIMFIMFSFVFQPISHHRYLLLNVTIFTILGAVMIPIGIWRLYRIEPDRVGRR